MTSTASYGRIGNLRNENSTYLVALLCLLSPVTTTLVVLCSLYSRVHTLFWNAKPKQRRTGKKILVTGSLPAAISIARALHEAGNDVVVADYARLPILPTARFSNAFKSFHNLYKVRKRQRSQRTVVMNTLGIRIELTLPYLFSRKSQSKPGFTQDIVALIQQEKPDLWIPCALSQIESTSIEMTRAIGSVQQRALCNVLHADEDTTEMLTDESAFTEYVEQLETGIRVPDSRTVTSRDEIHRILMACPDSRWELQDLSQSAASSETANDDEDVQFGTTDRRRWTWPVPPKPRTRFSDDPEDMPNKNLQMMSTGKVMLPLHSKNATYHCIAGMLITSEHPWTMREIVTGQTITAHLLVVHNQLRSVITSLSRENHDLGVQETELVPSTSLLHQPISLFAEVFAAHLPEDTSSFFSINFVVAGTATTMGTINTLFASSCLVGIHPAAPLLAMSSPEQAAMYVHAIADATSPRFSLDHDKEKNAETNVALVPASKNLAKSPGPRGVYTFHLSLLNLVFLPLLHIFTPLGSYKELYDGLLLFGEKLLMWQEDLFTIQDPWPWWWEWHVRIPLEYFAKRAFPGYMI
jgi:hypothetical protein